MKFEWKLIDGGILMKLYDGNMFELSGKNTYDYHHSTYESSIKLWEVGKGAYTYEVWGIPYYEKEGMYPY